VTEDYLRLGLRLGRHVDGLVDSYYGPPDLKQEVDSEPLREPATLVADAGRLLGSTDGWLRHQVVGLETVARKLAGEEIPYADEVERCCGVRPRRVPEEEFEAAHHELDAILPGDGDLAERYQAWREGDPLPRERLGPALETLAAELQGRTLETFGLPEGEAGELDYVTEEPWAAYNYYLGDLRSRIAVNTDVDMNASFIGELIAHELYPGHHTEHAWKEQRFVKERGQLEESILMIGTPQSLIAEGIAGLGYEILLDDLDGLTAETLAPLGIEYDAELGRAARVARQPLARVGANAALLLHEDAASANEARDYVMRWGLVSERRAQQSLEFITHPMWRSYVSTYDDGRELCRNWVGGDPQRFKRLLTEQLSPADLLGSA
jgi:hypothetical protein